MVPLWVKSNFSFLEGASHPDELVEEAHRLGLPALALTDRDVEGMLLASWVVGAMDAYLYLRDEYPACREILAAELHKIRAAGLDRATRVHLRRGADAYICGEESAMLESIEGKRGDPRHKPPFPAQVGLFGRPTLIQNVETMYWVREIVEKGPEAWSSAGRRGRKGKRFFSLSGRVKKPGVYLAPAGVTARKLIEEHAGGSGLGQAAPNPLRSLWKPFGIR